MHMHNSAATCQAAWQLFSIAATLKVAAQGAKRDKDEFNEQAFDTEHISIFKLMSGKW